MIKNKFCTSSLKARRGLTLMESLISLMVCGILLTLMQVTHNAATGIEQTISGRMEANDQLIQSSAFLLKDLRNAGPSSITDVPADGTWYSNSITFYTATGASGTSVTWDSNAITFSLSGTTLTRTYNSTSRIIATNISRLRFFRSSAAPDVLLIDIEATKTSLYGGPVTAEFTFTVKLRH